MAEVASTISIGIETRSDRFNKSRRPRGFFGIRRSYGIMQRSPQENLHRFRNEILGFVESEDYVRIATLGLL